MEQYVFMTDSDSDLPYALKKQYDIPVVYMPYAMEGKEYFDDLVRPWIIIPTTTGCARAQRL